MNIKLVLSMLFSLILIISCSKSEPQLLSSKSEPQLLSYGPNNIKAGTYFNGGSDSQESAFWVITKDVPLSAKIFIDDRLLNTVIDSSGSKGSAYLPKELYKEPGTHKLYILDTKTNIKTNSLDFIVH